MNNSLSLHRLFLAIREFWLLKRVTMLIIPVVVLILLIVFYLWPGAPLYHLVVNNNIDTNSDMIMTDFIYFDAKNINLFILATLIPLFIFINTGSYLRNMNSSIRTTMTPFSKTERIITLWGFSGFIILLTIFSFSFFDKIIIEILKYKYLEEVIIHLEAEASFYFKFRSGSYFAPLLLNSYLLIFSIYFCLTSLYHLASVFFKKNSLIRFSLILILMGILTCYFLYQFLQHFYGHMFDIYIIDSIGTDIVRVVITLCTISLLIASFYHRLKEREI